MSFPQQSISRTDAQELVLLTLGFSVCIAALIKGAAPSQSTHTESCLNRGRAYAVTATISLWAFIVFSYIGKWTGFNSNRLFPLVLLVPLTIGAYYGYWALRSKESGIWVRALGVLVLLVCTPLAIAGFYVLVAEP